jgi:hypothetical protein
MAFYGAPDEGLTDQGVSAKWLERSVALVERASGDYGFRRGGTESVLGCHLGRSRYEARNREREPGYVAIGFSARAGVRRASKTSSASCEPSSERSGVALIRSTTPSWSISSSETLGR